MDMGLPAELRAAIEAEALPGASARARGLSDAYRALRPSSEALADAADISAYLTTRLPATYAALRAALAAAAQRLPGFAPRTLLDAGAGPGTASWAAAGLFPGLAAISLLDHNRQLLALAARLAAFSPQPALAAAECLAGDLTAPAGKNRRFDLVLAGYALTELPDARLVETALGLWAGCDGLLVIVEPGRPRDFRRLLAVRTALLGAGAAIVAPCPHASACPLPADDWCHFGVRLPRLRAHRQAKGATLGYEDEKFGYLALARPALAARPVAMRVLRPPVLRKFEVALALCGPAGLASQAVPRRDPGAFRAARRLEWGDGIDVDPPAGIGS